MNKLQLPRPHRLLFGVVCLAFLSGCATGGDHTLKPKQPWRAPGDHPAGGIEIRQRAEYPAWMRFFGWFVTPIRDSD